MVPEHTLPA